MRDVLAIVLAGGAGERLAPLTLNTAKPAVPFGGCYRIIDFTLSNCINSDVRRIFILTQYKALELTRHVREGWDIFSGELNEFIEVIPPMKRIHQNWYLGTADAVYQNIESIMVEKPETTLILSGDHIYKMDYQDMLSWHQRSQADATIATIQVAPEQACRFGIVDTDGDYRVTGFEEKPRHGRSARSPANPDMVNASMGVYAIDTQILLRSLMEDAGDTHSSHDFGKDVLPKLITRGRAKVMAYDFRDLNRKKVRYWRDVGAIDAYYEANMDLVAIEPEFNLYDRQWPLRTRLEQQPPAKFVLAEEHSRMGVAIDSIVSAGCIISGGRVMRSVLSPGVRVNSYSEVDSSIIMANSQIGRHSRIRRAIIPPNSVIPEFSVIGHDLEQDRSRGYTVTESGVVAVPPIGVDVARTVRAMTA
ncbi:MAG TPA: glucose-1-phosphate adenylyltransferase [Bryobacteraceae bacterium]|nr:glucose-1-phosphate adenylyltransferase [Bryobacteraceae bacterium]